ncbi:MAG: hypothetical protein JO358_17180 [Alphaproteobacteria bacterium]|nr:hypothetical protein [Alphaproteobacteria bacterium]
MTERKGKAEQMDVKELLARDQDFVRVALEALLQAALDAEMTEARVRARLMILSTLGLRFAPESPQASPAHRFARLVRVAAQYAGPPMDFGDDPLRRWRPAVMTTTMQEVLHPDHSSAMIRFAELDARNSGMPFWSVLSLISVIGKLQRLPQATHRLLKLPSLASSHPVPLRHPAKIGS